MRIITATPLVIRQMVLITATTLVFPFSQSFAEPDIGLVWPNTQTTETVQDATSSDAPVEALDITGNLGGDASGL